MDNMKNRCKEHNCIKCCIETRMPLSNQDIKCIRTLGYKERFFVVSKNGWLQLKNKYGKCVFHNGSECLIYKQRPEGCELYPVIYDKDNSCAILDRYCPHRKNFKITDRKTKKLSDLVLKLEHEKALRKNKKVIKNHI